MQSILPEELHDDIPTGFNVAGHVGRLRPYSSWWFVGSFTPDKV
jgi:hypothetical protein